MSIHHVLTIQTATVRSNVLAIAKFFTCRSIEEYRGSLVASISEGTLENRPKAFLLIISLLFLLVNDSNTLICALP